MVHLVGIELDDDRGRGRRRILRGWHLRVWGQAEVAPLSPNDEVVRLRRVVAGGRTRPEEPVRETHRRVGRPHGHHDVVRRPLRGRVRVVLAAAGALHRPRAAGGARRARRARRAGRSRRASIAVAPAVPEPAAPVVPAYRPRPRCHSLPRFPSCRPCPNRPSRSRPAVPEPAEPFAPALPLAPALPGPPDEPPPHAPSVSAEAEARTRKAKELRRIVHLIEVRDTYHCTTTRDHPPRIPCRTDARRSLDCLASTTAVAPRAPLPAPHVRHLRGHDRHEEDVRAGRQVGDVDHAAADVGRRPCAARRGRCRSPAGRRAPCASSARVTALPMSSWLHAMSYLRPSSATLFVRPVMACLLAV